MSEQGKQPGGSFKGLGAVREQAAQDRDDRLAAEAEAKRKAKEDEDRKKSDEAKKDAPPEQKIHLSMIHGELTETELLEKYPALVEQVKQKNYMLQGFATHEFKVGETVVHLRTLRKSEQRVVSLLSEGTLDDQGMQIYHPDDLNRWSLVFALARVGGQNMEPIKVPAVAASRRFVDDTNAKLKALVDSDDVKKRTTLLDNWPVPVFQLVLSHFLDASEAFRRAILKDMANPS